MYTFNLGFEFWVSTMFIWQGGKQWTLEREFLVLMHQATATSKSQLVSSKTLSKISASIRSIFSNKPLLHGTAAVVSKIIPKLSHVC